MAGKFAEMMTENNAQIQYLKRRVANLEAELRVSDELLKDRTNLLKIIPECEAHGDQCVPHAMEWIAKAKTLAKVIEA